MLFLASGARPKAERSSESFIGARTKIIELNLKILKEIFKKICINSFKGHANVEYSIALI